MTTSATDSQVMAASQVVAQGSVSALLVAFYHDALDLALPFLIPALILILVDLFFGIEAAKKRGEDVRASRAIRRTVDKIVSYFCWIVLSATLSVAFAIPYLSRYILGFVVGLELLSVISNYLFARGKKITGFWDALMKVLGNKIGTDLSGVKLEDSDKRNGDDKQ